MPNSDRGSQYCAHSYQKAVKTAILWCNSHSASSTGYPYFAITTSGNGGEQGLNGTSVLPTGFWQHLAVVKIGNTGILYVNNQEIARNNNMTLNPEDLGLTSNNYLGRSQWSQAPYLNGSVRIVDAMLVAQYAAELSPVGFKSANADVNCDNSININDALLIARYTAGLTKRLPCPY